MEYVNSIINVLLEEGIAIEYTGVDLDLREYITDSLQFISCIINLEKKLNIEIPDEYLLYDSISSLHSFSEIIKVVAEENCMAHND